MKVIVNNLIPFKGFLAVCLYPFVFVRKEHYESFTTTVLQHESIHAEQQKELLVVLFLLCYVLEWLFRLLFTKDRFSHKAYRNTSFEKEAYAHQDDKGYLEKRKHFAQWRKI